MTGRRDVLVNGAASVFGGTRFRQAMRPDQDAIFYVVIIGGGAGSGLFIYDPVVAAGDLIASGTDSLTSPTGDTTKKGLTSYAPGNLTARLYNGALLVVANTTDTEGSVSAAPGELDIISPHSASGTAVDIALLASDVSGLGEPLVATAADIQVGKTVFLVPSGDATGIKDTAAIAAVFNAGRQPTLLPGTWNINCGDATLTGLGVGQWVNCLPGVFINGLGTGDLFYWSFNGSYSGNTTIGGGILGYPKIRGTSLTGNATAIHAGDIESLRFEAIIRDFNAGTDSWGALFDNHTFYTERALVDLETINCGNTPGHGGGVGFTVTDDGVTLTSTGSFARLTGRINITQTSNQHDGLVLMHGARIYDSPGLAMAGNFTATGAATTAAAVRVTGTSPAGHPDAGGFSGIDHSALYFTPECAAGANGPATISFGTAGSNQIVSSTGLMDFSVGGGFANAVNYIASFQFDGPVYGDPHLQRSGIIGTRPYFDGDPGNGGLITTRYTDITILDLLANRTAMVLQQPQASPNSYITVINRSAFHMAFDIAANSNVADGVADVIAANTAARYVWDGDTVLWYRCG